ncbi:arginine-tRNA-protein transferase [Naematelia encephala]|uniref:Arginyl-tRNA--protein transferase 1 n=1 Tax=Naematelia encephala TaxID=71784 RepID=A0A1Y2B6C0_9TREE|nr:arginine-tRNA-protein transferase [Naematelia encephala]
MARSCCPQYTIRLDVSAFKAGKKERQVVNRWNRFLSDGIKPGQLVDDKGTVGQQRVDKVEGQVIESGQRVEGQLLRSDQGVEEPGLKSAQGVEGQRIKSGPRVERQDTKSGRGSNKQAGIGNGNGTLTGTGDGRGQGDSKGKAKQKQKEKGNGAIDVLEQVKMYEEEQGGLVGKHCFTTELVPAKPTNETCALYKKYQIAVHRDPPEKVTMRSFSRFLCESPLGEAPIIYGPECNTASLPKTYGSYHLLYRVDKALIGISVIDILPACVSSVYFIWDPDWAWASLGKLSALREAALVRDIRQAGIDKMRWLYMGYWIPDCVKMKYKSEYGPSYLLDPGTNVFHLLDAKLEKFLQAHPTGYMPFSHIASFPPDDLGQAVASTASTEKDEDEDEDSMSEVEELDAFPSSPPPPGFADPSSFSNGDIARLLVLMQSGRRGSRLVQLDNLLGSNSDALNRQVRELVAAVGMEMMARSGGGLEQVKDKGILFFG